MTKKRGRPPKPGALSNAEHQALYRLRKAQQEAAQKSALLIPLPDFERRALRARAAREGISEAALAQKMLIEAIRISLT